MAARREGVQVILGQTYRTINPGIDVPTKTSTYQIGPRDALANPEVRKALLTGAGPAMLEGFLKKYDPARFEDRRAAVRQKTLDLAAQRLFHRLRDQPALLNQAKYLYRTYGAKALVGSGQLGQIAKTKLTDADKRDLARYEAQQHQDLHQASHQAWAKEKINLYRAALSELAQAKQAGEIVGPQGRAGVADDIKLIVARGLDKKLWSALERAKDWDRSMTSTQALVRFDKLKTDAGTDTWAETDLAGRREAAKGAVPDPRQAREQAAQQARLVALDQARVTRKGAFDAAHKTHDEAAQIARQAKANRVETEKVVAQVKARLTQDPTDAQARAQVYQAQLALRQARLAERAATAARSAAWTEVQKKQAEYDRAIREHNNVSVGRRADYVPTISPTPYSPSRFGELSGPIRGAGGRTKTLSPQSAERNLTPGRVWIDVGGRVAQTVREATTALYGAKKAVAYLDESKPFLAGEGRHRGGAGGLLGERRDKRREQDKFLRMVGWKPGQGRAIYVQKIMTLPANSVVRKEFEKVRTERAGALKAYRDVRTSAIRTVNDFRVYGVRIPVSLEGMSREEKLNLYDAAKKTGLRKGPDGKWRSQADRAGHVSWDSVGIVRLLGHMEELEAAKVEAQEEADSHDSLHHQSRKSDDPFKSRKQRRDENPESDEQNRDNFRRTGQENEIRTWVNNQAWLESYRVEEQARTRLFTRAAALGLTPEQFSRREARRLSPRWQPQPGDWTIRRDADVSNWRDLGDSLGRAGRVKSDRDVVVAVKKAFDRWLPERDIRGGASAASVLAPLSMSAKEQEARFGGAEFRGLLQSLGSIRRAIEGRKGLGEEFGPGVGTLPWASSVMSRFAMDDFEGPLGGKYRDWRSEAKDQVSAHGVWERLGAQGYERASVDGAPVSRLYPFGGGDGIAVKDPNPEGVKGRIGGDISDMIEDHSDRDFGHAIEVKTRRRSETIRTEALSYDPGLSVKIPQ